MSRLLCFKQGSIVTQTMLGGLAGCTLKFLMVYMCQKLWKLAGSWYRPSYCKNKQAYFFGPSCIGDEHPAYAPNWNMVHFIFYLNICIVGLHLLRRIIHSLPRCLLSAHSSTHELLFGESKRNILHVFRRINSKIEELHNNYGATSHHNWWPNWWRLRLR